jgi:hypothetical protein
MIALTFDVDWAPEEVIHDTVSILEDFDVKATFFATHDSDQLKSLESTRFEIGLHPNFNNLLTGNTNQGHQKITDELYKIYPMAKGIRSHSLSQSSLMLDHWKSIGLLYESNLFMPYFAVIEPFTYPNGLVRIPFNWEDDVHWGYKKEFSNFKIDIQVNRLNVFSFHPIHVFANTPNERFYNEVVRSIYQKPDNLLKARNIEVTGVRDGLINLLKQIKSTQKKTFTLGEVYNDYQKEKGLNLQAQ